MIGKNQHWLQAIIFILVLLLHSSKVRAYNKGFADIVDPLLAGVVKISTTREVKSSDPSIVPPGSPFEDLFRQFFEKNGNNNIEQSKTHKIKSLGSGFIVETSGYIVTNNHVIADAQEILITFHGQEETELKAKIIGRDPRTDLALLKVNSKKPLKALNWGHSQDSRVGDWVIAIGNPFGLGNTVTSGIISNIGRDVTMGPTQYIEGFLQIDAAVNQGNSGGPAFNTTGEVIGVVNAIATTTGGNIGIGFAIPSEIAASTIEQLKKYGRTRRGHLGVGVLPINKEKAEYYGLMTTQGAEINEVNKGGPADKAGLKEGDIILEFNGKKVKSSRHLPRLVGETTIGIKVPVIIWRTGKSSKLFVVIGDYEKSEKNNSNHNSKTLNDVDDKENNIQELGLVLHALNFINRERYNISNKTNGILIINVEKEGIAASKGLRRGDIITSIDGQEIISLKNLKKAINYARIKKRKLMRWQINRQGHNLFFVLPILNNINKYTK